MEATAWGFFLVILSGLCAPLGACVVCFMKLSHKNTTLAASISLAAGVMVFVSLTEVLGDAVEDLRKGGLKESIVHTVAYASFFGGIIMCSFLDIAADCILKLAAWRSCTCRNSSINRSSNSSGSSSINDSADSLASPDCSSLHTKRKDAELLEPGNAQGCTGNPYVCDILTVAACPTSDNGQVIVDLDLQDAAAGLQSNDDLQLIRTSLLIGLALGFHNLPEGLATFVGFVSSPHLGITIAIAIAIHNLPEGIAIGVPVYFATGSRWKAIGYAAVSGLAEPFGALIGLAVHLSDQLDLVAMGIIMALVAGIMAGIAFRELIPRALQYDPANRYAAPGIFAGMGIMAFSLLLLGFWQPA